MRLQKDLVLAVCLFDGLAGLLVRVGDGIDILSHSRQIRPQPYAAGLIHLTAIKVEESSQVTGVAHVHGIGDAVLAGPDGLVDACIHEAGELIVLIGRHHELLHGKAHLLGQKSAHEVSEVTAGHREDDLLALWGDARVSIEVIDGLGQQSADVDGIGRGEIKSRQIGIGKGLLDQSLAVIKLSIYGEREDIFAQGGHLAALPLCYLLLRE